ncbi:MAG: GntR family transcriptional regulator [Deltaproteobacteria bacterium]|nr:GntR family transcriptional regulator [Deltaproteobacteria bacterium]
MTQSAFKMEKGAATLYHQLARTLRERIISGVYFPGEAIPTEPQLCEEFNLSRITVRQAVAILENEGMVQRQQGRGTFVMHFTRKSLGWNYGRVEDLIYLSKQTRLELTSKRKIKAPEKITRDLHLPLGHAVYAFKGIRYIKDNHRASYRAYVVESIGRNIQINQLDNPVLFLEIEKISDERITTANQFVYATSATKEIANDMNLKPGNALLATKRIYLNEAGRPLMIAVTNFPSEVYQSIAVLERK